MKFFLFLSLLCISQVLSAQKKNSWDGVYETNNKNENYFLVLEKDSFFLFRNFWHGSIVGNKDTFNIFSSLPISWGVFSVVNKELKLNCDYSYDHVMTVKEKKIPLASKDSFFVSLKATAGRLAFYWGSLGVFYENNTDTIFDVFVNNPQFFYFKNKIKSLIFKGKPPLPYTVKNPESNCLEIAVFIPINVHYFHFNCKQIHINKGKIHFRDFKYANPDKNSLAIMPGGAPNNSEYLFMPKLVFKKKSVLPKNYPTFKRVAEERKERVQSFLYGSFLP